jgi:hypothetical protein
MLARSSTAGGTKLSLDPSVNWHQRIYLPLITKG